MKSTNIVVLTSVCFALFVPAPARNGVQACRVLLGGDLIGVEQFSSCFPGIVKLDFNARVWTIGDMMVVQALSKHLQ